MNFRPLPSDPITTGLLSKYFLRQRKKGGKLLEKNLSFIVRHGFLCMYSASPLKRHSFLQAQFDQIIGMPA